MAAYIRTDPNAEITALSGIGKGSAKKIVDVLGLPDRKISTMLEAIGTEAELESRLNAFAARWPSPGTWSIH